MFVCLFSSFGAACLGMQKSGLFSTCRTTIHTCHQPVQMGEVALSPSFWSLQIPWVVFALGQSVSSHTSQPPAEEDHHPVSCTSAGCAACSVFVFVAWLFRFTLNGCASRSWQGSRILLKGCVFVFLLFSHSFLQPQPPTHPTVYK